MLQSSLMNETLKMDGKNITINGNGSTVEVSSNDLSRFNPIRYAPQVLTLAGAASGIPEGPVGIASGALVGLVAGKALKDSFTPGRKITVKNLKAA
jgi:hypothetical protein